MYEAKNWHAMHTDISQSQREKRGITYAIVVLVQVVGHHRLVASESFPEICVSVAGDAKGRGLDVVGKGIELLRMKENASKRFMSKHLSKDHASIERDVLILVAFERSKQDFGLVTEVFHRREPRAYLSSKEIVEDLYDVLACLEFELRYAQKEVLE